MKIFVRFGHDTIKSGAFTGAVGIITEKEAIDKYAPYLAETLYHAGHTVRTYSHTDRVYATADEAGAAARQAAKDWGADLFVACHANVSATNPNASYSMCFYRNDPLSEILADAVSQAAYSTLELNHNNGGIDGSNMLDTANSMNMSSIIIEPFFISTAADVQKFNSRYASLGTALGSAILNNI